MKASQVVSPASSLPFFTPEQIPGRIPSLRPNAVHARSLGQCSISQSLSCPLIGAVPVDVPICALGCWRVKTKHPSQVFQVSNGK